MTLEVVWFERRGGVYLGAIRGGGERKVTLVDEEGNSLKLQRKKVLHQLTARVPEGSPKEIRVQLRRLRQELSGKLAPPEIDLLWSALEDGRSYRLDELSGLYFGASDDAEVASTIASLTQEESGRLSSCFRFGEGLIERVDADTKQRIDERRAREVAEIAAQEDFLDWYLESDAAGLASPPAGVVGPLESLRVLALEGDRGSVGAATKRLAKRLGADDPDALLSALENKGLLPRHVNELPQRRGLSYTFPRRVLSAADELLAALPDPTGEDLRHLPTIAVDDAGTIEVDDAISAWEEGGRLHVAVHIACVAGGLPKDHPVDVEAARRATTVYFASDTIRMLPANLLEALSLTEGESREALTWIGAIGDDGLPEQGRFTPSIVRVDRQITYAESPPAPAAEVMERLLPVAHALKEAREARGARTLSIPSLKMQLNEDGEPNPKLVRSDLPAHLVVSELMVLYNARAAACLAAAGRPALFRSQTERLKPKSAPEGAPQALVDQFTRRSMPRTVIGPTPAPHLSMGLDAYVQSTSPLRRMGDLVAQRQLLSVLNESPAPYTVQDVEELRETLLPLERRARTMEEDRIRYWIACWLRTESVSRTFGAIVSRPAPRLQVYLPELDREFPCRVPDEPPAVGDEVRVAPARCEPRQRDIVMELS